MSSGSSLGPNDYEKRSKLSHVRGVGSSYRGSTEWLAFKLSGAFAIPLSLYIFVSILLGNASSFDAFVSWLANPFNTTMLILTIIVGSTHLALGAIAVFDDYLHIKAVNFTATILIKLFFMIAVVICVVSVLLVLFRNF